MELSFCPKEGWRQVQFGHLFELRLIKISQSYPQVKSSQLSWLNGFGYVSHFCMLIFYLMFNASSDES